MITPHWPNGARCAVMLSFDVDGPSNWINRDKRVWDLPQTFSLGSYGPWRGIPRLLDLLDRHGVPGSFYVPAWVADAFPDRFCEIDRSGHEIGHHGYLHEVYFERSIDEQRALIERSQKIFERLIGKPAIGFRTPSGDYSKGSPALLRELGFSYSSSMRGDDRPYRWQIDGKSSDLIEIPAHWELNDFNQFGFNVWPPFPKGQDRISPHASTYENWEAEFDGYYRFGLCYVIMFHPQVIGKPGRVALLERLIRHIKSYPGVWFARGNEIAEWWRNQY